MACSRGDDPIPVRKSWGKMPPRGASGARFKARDTACVNEPRRPVDVIDQHAMPLRVGEKAPEFDVVASSGKHLVLSELVGKKNVVLYFYPGDFTPVCTKETCGFRDAYEELASADTEVIGVSVDSDDSHRKFAEKYGLPFALVSDENKELARRYQATSFLGGILGKAGRITYVIDKKGQIAGVFQGELNANKHVQGARDLIKKLG
jgi:peroxiredoxin Q/BCP